MANKVKSMHQLKTVIRLLASGESMRGVSRHTGISRTTISKYQFRITCAGLRMEECLKMDERELEELLGVIPEARVISVRPPQALKLALEGQFERLSQELKRTGVTRKLLWQKYRQKTPDGYGYSQFCYLLQDYSKTRQASYHLRHEPAEELMVDFAGDKISYVDVETGKVIACEILVCVLPFSGYIYAIALPSQKQEDYISGLVACLDFLGCLPKSIVMDNLKSGVKKVDRYEPVFTDQISYLSNHYGINCTAARVRKPKDKACVENAVSQVYRVVHGPLRDKQHHSLAELNASILAKITAFNQQNYQGEQYSRKDLFEGQEKAQMSALPNKPYLFFKQTVAKVQMNYHALLGEDKHYYSVPYQYIGKQVKLIYNTLTVEIYHAGTRIGFYHRKRQKNGYTTQKQHMPPNHQFYQEQQGWDGDYFRKKGLLIGQQTFEFIDALLKSKPVEQHAYNACKGILRLAGIYDHQRLNNACSRALLYPYCPTKRWRKYYAEIWIYWNHKTRINYKYHCTKTSVERRITSKNSKKK